MVVQRDYEDLLRLFNRHKVKYCVVGSFAVAFYALPRYTKDIDLLVEASAENASNIVKALNEFGFGSLKLTETDFIKEGNVIQLGFEPVRIDILTSLPGLKFGDIWKGKKSGKYGRQKTFFIGLNELIKNKKSSLRKQDIIDLESLRKKK